MTSTVNFVPPPDPTSLASSNFTATGILNSIFNEVLTMTTALQNAAAAQANRLTTLTQWQQQYTTVMGQVHTFIQGNGDAIGGNDSSDAAHRTDLNRVNSNYIQTLQNEQSVVSDNAKALQSNVNQSNDAVNQQSNLGTAILQELSSLLSVMFTPQ